jgi:hypothetical protein
MNISGFEPVCPKKSYHGMLFKDGANGEQRVHVYTVIAAARMTME